MTTRAQLCLSPLHTHSTTLRGEIQSNSLLRLSIFKLLFLPRIRMTVSRRTRVPGLVPSSTTCPQTHSDHKNHAPTPPLHHSTTSNGTAILVPNTESHTSQPTTDHHQASTIMFSSRQYTLRVQHTTAATLPRRKYTTNASSSSPCCAPKSPARGGANLRPHPLIVDTTRQTTTRQTDHHATRQLLEYDTLEHNNTTTRHPDTTPRHARHATPTRDATHATRRRRSFVVRRRHSALTVTDSE